jgi:tetratricopeptide (TPR) repeat protein
MSHRNRLGDRIRAGANLLGLTLVLSLGATHAQELKLARPQVSKNSSIQDHEKLKEAASRLQSGRTQEAETLVREVLASNQKSYEAHALLAAIFDRRGDASEAEQEYQSALKLNPRYVFALSNLGVLLARTNRTSEAIDKFETVLKIEPSHQLAVFNLGVLYAASGDYRRAIPLLEKAGGIDPIKPQIGPAADRALILTLVNSYLHVDRRADALALAHQLESVAGNDPKTLFTLALSLAEGREYTEAVRLFQKTDELRPQTYEVLYNLGLALYNLDRLKEAQAALLSASNLSAREADPYYRLGLVASAEGDTKAALTYWTRALELRPVFPEANFMIGEELLKNKLSEKSIPFYERAAEQSQGQLIYVLRFGVANVRGQRYDRAREIFTDAIKRFPNNANLYFLLGYAARAAGQYDQAVDAFRTALKLQPDNPDVLDNLGYIASQRGENAEAETLLRRAIALGPESFPAYHDLGRLLVKLKRYDEAVPVLRRGVELNSKDPGVHYQLFLAYSRLKKTDEAKRELAEFKRLDEVNRHAATPLGDSAKNPAGMEVEPLPPLPATVSGETAKPRTPVPF